MGQDRNHAERPRRQLAVRREQSSDHAGWRPGHSLRLILSACALLWASIVGATCAAT